MRVVLDTNVLVAAARSRRGASHALLSGLPDPRFEPVVSVSVFVEYRAVLLRPENLLGRTPEQTEGFARGEPPSGSILSLAAHTARRG